MAIFQQLPALHAVDFLPISEPQLAEIQHETVADLVHVLQCLAQVTLQGWPDQKEALPSELHPYFTVRDKLTAQDGIFFKGLRCVISTSLRPKISNNSMVPSQELKGAFDMQFFGLA